MRCEGSGMPPPAVVSGWEHRAAGFQNMVLSALRYCRPSDVGIAGMDRPVLWMLGKRAQRKEVIHPRLHGKPSQVGAWVPFQR